MSVVSARGIIIQFSGDVIAANQFSAANNTDSPAQIDIVTLALGANIITPPTGGSTPVAVTIIPPEHNMLNITLKGDASDIGIVLHRTDPTSIALFEPTDTFVLDAEDDITGVRLVWS